MKNLHKIEKIRVKKLAFLFLLFLVFHSACIAQTIQDKHSKTKIVIGEQIAVDVELNLPANSNYVALFKDTLSSHVEVAAFTPVDTLKSSPELQLKQTIYITSFDSGRWQCPALTWLIQSKGKMDTLRTKTFFIDVQTIAVDTTKAWKDIKAPYKAPWTFKEFLYEYYPYIIAVFVFALLVVFAIYYWNRRKQNKPLFEIKKVIEPPYAIALRNLDLLKEKKLWQQARVKEYHSELSDILRIYLEKGFNTQALEQTTDEIIKTLKQSKIIGEIQSIELLQKILVLADLVKFAKEQPLPDENEKSLSMAYMFVNMTKPVEKPKEDNQNVEPLKAIKNEQR